ncbi:MAG: hypothetical protein K2X93_12130 [Candidatus Obscuribacterales bacterium]|nr:hypothetical protein [Candidatus Obscuribacterales bacterium]
MNTSTKNLPALKPLARDHGIVLVCAQHGRKAVRASKDDRLRLAVQMRTICHEQIYPNLEDEQWILSPFIGDAQLREEFHQRHRTIRSLTKELFKVDLYSDPGLGLVARVANVLDDYVRWEENTLFPRIGEGIENDGVEHLGKLTSALEKNRRRPTQQLHTSVTLEQPSGLRRSSAN